MQTGRQAAEKRARARYVRQVVYCRERSPVLPARPVR